MGLKHKPQQEFFPACNQQRPAAIFPTIIIFSNTVMRVLFFLLLVSIAFPSFSQEKPFTINDLPVKWTEISKMDNGEWVVFEPCDVPNGLVEITTVKGKRKLVLSIGYEALGFEVTNTRSINGTTFQFIGSYEMAEPKRTDTIQVKYDRYNRRAEWTISMGDSKTTDTYAPTEDIDNYKTVIQPCKECWDDCPDDPAAQRAQPGTSNASEKDMEGTYNTDPKKEGYWQRLTIKKNANNTYAVAIAFGGSPKGCKFTGTGEWKNGRIEIQLSTVNKEMKGVMTITKVNDHMEIYTVNEDDRFELMWFCGGGASLAGDYYKEK